MRKLNVTDMLRAMRLVKKAGLRQLFNDLLNGLQEKEQDAAAIGLNAFFAIMEAVSAVECEKELLELLAGPLECDPGDVAEMSLPDLWVGLKQLAQENDLERFFTQVSDMMNSGQQTGSYGDTALRSI